uniref:Aa_trans domain-containing protein n=1 Tax=Globodera pallida TaxID=36090 RepID=A0A183BVX1_GLOPA
MCVWILCGAISTLGAYCYVELGTSIRRSGGDFAYLCHVKWNAIAFMFMSVGCVLIYPMMLAIQANTFAEYIVQGFGLKEMLPDDSLEQIVFKKLVGFLILSRDSK